MLRIIQNSTPAGAKSYYSTADYYTEGQELTGVWRGKGAERLGLAGAVGKEAWDALCDNRGPRSGETLTVRQKDVRRVGYDFNFHVPKSVSVLYGLTEDERILAAFREAVGATMQEMESEMRARVRKGGRDEDRTTGNMVWGEFVHTTARPVDGVPDPHLHAHCFVFNTTWDAEEGRWKAGQFAGVKRDAPYFEAVFHSKFARGLAELGLPVERTRKGWELAGVPESVADKFSRRTAEIEEAARERGISDPEAKGELGAKTRSGKAKQLSLHELQELWRGRLTGDESSALRSAAERIGADAIPREQDAARAAAALAVAYVFERKSVVPERALLAAALKRAYGSASRADVEVEVAKQPGLLRAQRKGVACVTTREVLAEEKAMVNFARSGRGTCRPLVSGEHRFVREWLGEEQRRAVQRLLALPDRVILLRGRAGTGKTTLMQETVEAIEANGKRVFTFAPSAEASRGVLRTEGFTNADTVARLLLDEKLQERVRGQVVWIDEAGLLGSRTMARLFDLAGKLDARVILSGDRRQHGSVERGSALRLLEEDAGLVPAELREIRRQKGDYKMAVAALAEGRTDDGFRLLDRMGWVREVGGERYKVLAADYVGTVQDGKTALVVSPTHAEGDRITAEIRAQLKHTGKVASEERLLTALASLNLTEAERADTANYRAGDVLVFHQNAKGHSKGDRVRVGVGPLPLEEVARFQVFRPREIAIAAGDVVRVTKNGVTADGKHKLNNGALYQVAGFDEVGNITLANGWRIGREFGHLNYGYCVTSHASQGKTVDRVFIGQASDSFPATSREQFYVSVSRGREAVVVYTDDKEALLAAVDRSDDRVTATEFLQRRDDRHRQAEERTRDGLARREQELPHG